jgi:hypothetical protein
MYYSIIVYTNITIFIVGYYQIKQQLTTPMRARPAPIFSRVGITLNLPAFP